MEIRRKKNKTSLLRGENVIWTNIEKNIFFLWGGGEEVGWSGIGWVGDTKASRYRVKEERHIVKTYCKNYQAILQKYALLLICYFKISRINYE